MASLHEPAAVAPASGPLAEVSPESASAANHTLLRIAGLAAFVAGMCYVLVGLFHPANVASSATTTRWLIVHLIACAMSFFGLLGLAGLHARQASRTSWLGLCGYVLLSLWMALIMGFSFVEALV